MPRVGYKRDRGEGMGSNHLTLTEEGRWFAAGCIMPNFKEKRNAKEKGGKSSKASPEVERRKGKPMSRSHIDE